MVSIRIVSEILKPQMSSGRGCRGEGRADVRLEARVGWGGGGGGGEGGGAAGGRWKPAELRN